MKTGLVCAKYAARKFQLIFFSLSIESMCTIDRGSIYEYVWHSISNIHKGIVFVIILDLLDIVSL